MNRADTTVLPRPDHGPLRRGLAALLAISAAVAVGCSGPSAMTELAEAQRRSAALLIEFTKAADASSRAVMADADEPSRAFAREAGQTKESVQKEIDALKPLLQDLRFLDEAASLDEFASRFADYRALDDRILDLAVENSNLKAQQMSFGPVQEAADAFRDALDSLSASDTMKDDWRIKALCATALAAARQIQVLEAPHIAEADDAKMTRNESEMAKADAATRVALQRLAALVPPGSRSRLTNATAAFDTLMSLNAQVLALSRRNTNVRSLALSLNDKGKLTRACEESLRKLSDALAGRVVGGTR